MIGSILYFHPAIADQACELFTVTLPTEITHVEVIEAIVAAAIIILSTASSHRETER
jgi:hypothetical protein